MKKLLIALFAIMLLAVSAMAQQDPDDLGTADTLILVTDMAQFATGADSAFTLEVYIFNNPQALASVALGLQWDHRGVLMDSAAWSAYGDGKFQVKYLFYKNSADSAANVDSTNATGWFQCSGASVVPGLVVPSSDSRKHLATYWFHVDSMLPGESVTFDTCVFIPTVSYSAAFNTPAPVVSWGPFFAGDAVIACPTDVNSEQTDLLPTKFNLVQNYPNPFNPATTIQFDLPRSSKVMLEVFNVLGQRVATPVNGEMPAGFHKVSWNAGNQASGIYFYRLTANGDVVDTKKMMLLK